MNLSRSFKNSLNPHRSTKLCIFTGMALIWHVVLAETHDISDQIEIYKGAITEVIDGDTLTLCPKTEGKCGAEELFNVDLWGIDAPELMPRSQFHAIKTRDYVRDLVMGRKVVVEVKGSNTRGRKLVRLFILDHKHADLNLHLVLEGHAWAIDSNEVELKEYQLAQGYAKERRLGLWRELEPTQPWVWREQHKASP